MRAHDMEIAAFKKEISRREDERQRLLENVSRLESVLENEREKREECEERVRQLEGERDELKCTIKTQVYAWIHV
jgi:chromosome segregation ATPase